MPEAETAGPVVAAGPAEQRLGLGADGDLNRNPLRQLRHGQPPQYASTSSAMGQSSSSESKGLKRAGPYMRGAASHFGFKRKDRPGANNNGLDKAALEQRNYSQEALEKEQHSVTTAIKASPGLKPGLKDGAAAPVPPAARANRFGFRPFQGVGSGANSTSGRGLSNKVADSSAQLLQQAAKAPPGARPASSPASAPARGGKAAVAGRPAGRLPGRPSPPTSLPVTRSAQPAQPAQPGPRGSMLPRPQLAARAKEAKTAANYCFRGMAPIATFDDEIASSKESSMNEDSGLGSQLAGDADTLDGSPRGRGQRLRRAGPGGAVQRSLRDVRDEDDDPNVITEIVPIAKMVSRASLRSIASLGGATNMPSPKQLSAKSSVKSASSDEFHSDSGLFRDYGEGLDDATEAKVYIDCKTAEKRPAGRYMKDYGPGEQDEDYGQGEAMAENEWREELGAVVIDEDPASELRELQSSLYTVETTNLADLVAAAAAAEHGGLIEDESAPEDSLFSSSPPSTSEDSPAKHSQSPRRSPRRKVRTKRRPERPSGDKDSGSSSALGLAANKDCAGKADKSASAEKKEESAVLPQGHALSPEGSGTPSNSFSLSDGRDFLIDDEITDQPALTIHRSVRGHGGHGDDSEMASLAESAASMTLRERESSHRQAAPRASRAAGADGGSPSLADHLRSQRSQRSQLSRDNTLRLARFGSMDSLATNSIDSEDLMMDFEDDGESALALCAAGGALAAGSKYRSITKSWGGSPVLFWPRPRKTRSFSFVDLDQLKSVVGADALGRARGGVAREARARSQSCGGADDAGVEEDADDLAVDNDGVLLELSSLIESVHKTQGVAGRLSQPRVSAHAQGPPGALGHFPAGSGPGSAQGSAQGSAPDSPRFSLGSSGASGSGAPSPLRPPRQLASSDSDESAMMRVDRGTYQHMYQDVVHIKTMLLKLKRVLQEAETLNPFESSLKNGLLHQLVHADESVEDDGGKSRNPEEEVVDLKRQMVLMKQQMEEKDRTIQLMQVQMMKYERVSDESGENGEPADMCNAATQTERIRPVSAGPSILHSLPSDSNGSPLVSWTDTWGRRSRTPASASTNTGSSNIENRTSSTSRVPTATTRSSRSVIPTHQRLCMGSAADSPSSIPLVKGSHRKTGNALDSVPNLRRPPVVSAPRKAMASVLQKP